MTEQVLVPDIGEATDVEVIELLVAVGDRVEQDQSLLVLESDKASMEIPSPYEGVVTELVVGLGDTVDEGDVLLLLEVSNVDATTFKLEQTDAPPGVVAEQPGEAVGTPDPGVDMPSISELDVPVLKQTVENLTVCVPDVGEATEVIVVEILVSEGDEVTADQSLLVLESDKASMEIPSPYAGTLLEVLVTLEQAVEEGDPLFVLQVAGELAPVIEIGRTDAGVPVAGGVDDTVAVRSEMGSVEDAVREREAGDAEANTTADTEVDDSVELAVAAESKPIHAGPAVRKQAREYGVDLGVVAGSGRMGRILKEDIQNYVKSRMSETVTLTAVEAASSGIPEMPLVDYSQYGPVTEEKFSRMRRASARNLHRSWLNVPHVTQFDEADVTDMETFRKLQNQKLSDTGVKLTPLAFIVMGVVKALQKYPHFNASLTPEVDGLILKQYCHIGIAVETEDGLVVPVLRNADQMSLAELAVECKRLADDARNKRLKLDSTRGACFTISSLGGIGGTAFTPIVNAPEVAILGVSRSDYKPVFVDGEFVPRLKLPLSLSYDHRAIDGAQAVRFTSYLASLLSDIREILV